MAKNAPRTGAAMLNRAKSDVGRYSMSRSGMCQLWTRTQFGTPPSGSWAIHAWKNAKDKVHTRDARKIPRYAMVYFESYASSASRRYGHACIGLGDGKVISTDVNGLRSVGYGTIDWIERNWNMGLVGYVKVDGNGYTVFKSKTTPAKPPKAPSKPSPGKASPGNDWPISVQNVQTAAARYRRSGRTQPYMRSVKYLQYALNAYDTRTNLWSGKKLVVDGKYGERTHNVVRQLEKRLGHKITGTPGRDLVEEAAKGNRTFAK